MEELKTVQEAMSFVAEGFHDLDKSFRGSDTQAHFDRIRRDIIEAIRQAPAGHPAVILGSGELNDIPDELSASGKFPSVVYADIYPTATEQALARRNLQAKARVVKVDLSLVSPEFLRSVDQAIDQATNISDARERLIRLYQTQRAPIVTQQIPPALVAQVREHTGGLIVSSMLYYNLPTLLAKGIEQRIAQKFKHPLPVTDDLFPGDYEYLRAFAPVSRQLFSAHVYLLRTLLHPNGVAYLSSGVARFRPDVLTRYATPGRGGRPTPLTLERVIDGYSTVAEALRSQNLSTPIERFVLDLWNTYASQPAQAPMQWTVLGMLLNEPKSEWNEGFEHLATRVWIWHNRPDIGSAHLVQSLTMRLAKGSLPQLPVTPAVAPEAQKVIPAKPVSISPEVQQLYDQLQGQLPLSVRQFLTVERVAQWVQLAREGRETELRTQVDDFIRQHERSLLPYQAEALRQSAEALLLASKKPLQAGLEEPTPEEVDGNIKLLTGKQVKDRLNALAWVERVVSGETVPETLIQKAGPLVEALAANLRYEKDAAVQQAAGNLLGLLIKDGRFFPAFVIFQNTLPESMQKELVSQAVVRMTDQNGFTRRSARNFLITVSDNPSFRDVLATTVPTLIGYLTYDEPETIHGQPPLGPEAGFTLRTLAEDTMVGMVGRTLEGHRAINMWLQQDMGATFHGPLAVIGRGTTIYGSAIDIEPPLRESEYPRGYDPYSQPYRPSFFRRLLDHAASLFRWFVGRRAAPVSAWDQVHQYESSMRERLSLAEDTLSAGAFAQLQELSRSWAYHSRWPTVGGIGSVAYSYSGFGNGQPVRGLAQEIMASLARNGIGLDHAPAAVDPVFENLKTAPFFSYTHSTARAAIAAFAQGIQSDEIRQEIALRVLVAFIEQGDPIHDLFEQLHQQDLYSDPVYNRVITVMGMRRGWNPWSVGSILVTSYGSLADVAEPLSLRSPDGRPIPQKTRLETEPEEADPLGYRPARLANFSQQPFLLYEPGYRAWQEDSEEGKVSSVYLFGIDPNGSKVYYLMPWGEVLSCCTLYYKFVNEMQVRKNQALAYFLNHPEHRKFWEEEEEVQEAVLQSTLNLTEGRATIPPALLLALQRARPDLFPTEAEGRAFITHGLTLFFQDPLMAYKFAINGQFYQRISGHAEAINARVKDVRGQQAEALLREVRTPPALTVNFAIGKETAQQLGLVRGGFREDLPARTVWDVLGLLETEGLIPRAEVPAPGPISETPGLSQKLLNALRRGDLRLMVMAINLTVEHKS
ncbi:MAG: hypothetical protein HY211_01055 [Candidatus Omnitrophica bacterium]|nr:hypothetical protein [Candidatus Omnitrophota bacterium]